MTKFSFSRFTVRYGVVCLMWVVLLHHVYAVNIQALTPWKGGGFGMFSSIDLLETREMRYFDSASSEELTLDLPFTVRYWESIVRAMPTQKNLNKLQEAMQRVSDRPLRIEVWRRHFDSPRRLLTVYRALSTEPDGDLV